LSPPLLVPDGLLSLEDVLEELAFDASDEPEDALSDAAPPSFFSPAPSLAPALSPLRA
jgi:hypothetical protein